MFMGISHILEQKRLRKVIVQQKHFSMCINAHFQSKHSGISSKLPTKEAFEPMVPIG